MSAPDVADPPVEVGGARRVVLSVLMAAFVCTLVIWNLPDSKIRNEVRPVLRPVTTALGLDQDWGVFAPDPTTTSVALEADVHLADGTVVRYRFPDGDPVLGAYREFRWRKWERRVRLDDYRRYWEPTALWVAARFADRDPVEVVLMDRSSQTPAPGSDDVREWVTEEIFRLRVQDQS